MKDVEIHFRGRVILPVNLEDIDAIGDRGALHALAHGFFRRFKRQWWRWISKDAPLVSANWDYGAAMDDL